ncbi:MAG: tetratricopeptide repeat protein [Nitrospinota bacterium]
MPIEETKTDTMQKARTLVREGKYEQTIDALREAENREIKTSEYYLILGLSFYKMGDFLKAIQAFEAAKPESLELKTYIAYLYLLAGNAADAKKITQNLLDEYGDLPDIYVLKGNIKLKEENYEEASNFFKKASKLSPMSVKAIIGLANTFFFQRNFVKAEEFYLKGVYMSDTPGTYIALSNFYKRLRRYEDAENNIKIALKTHPENQHLLLALLNIYIKRGSNKEALNLIDSLITFFPNSTELKIKKIKTQLILGKTEEALQGIETLQAKFAAKTPYYVLLLKGEYYLRIGDLKQALYNFNNAFTKNSTSYETNYFLGLLNLLRGNYRSARQFLEKSIFIFPGFTRPHILLSYIYLSEKKYKLATEHCKIVLHLEPDNEAAHSLNGLSLFMQGFVREAKYEFDVVQKINPENIFASYITLLGTLRSIDQENVTSPKNGPGLSQVERLLLDFEFITERKVSLSEAKKRVLEYLEHSPNYLSYLLSGLYFEKKGDLPFASRLFEKSVMEKNPSVISYYKLAEMRHNQGKNKEAIQLLKKAIETNEYFIKSYRVLGNLYEEENDFASARDIYKEALALFPDDPYLLNNLGWLTLTYVKDKSSAYSYLREAVTQKPDDPDFLDSMAWWYFENREYTQAIALLKKAIKLPTHKPLLYYHLGYAYKKKGNKELALKNFNKALTLPMAEKYKNEIARILAE